MQNSTYRRLLLAGAAAVVIWMIGGGAGHTSGWLAGCANWPLCYGPAIVPIDAVTPVDLLHLLGGLVALGLILAGSLAAWWRDADDGRMRFLPRLAPLLLLLQLVVGATLPALGLTMLLAPVAFGLALLTLATLVAPLAALAVPDEYAGQRLGGRAARDLRRFRRMVFGTVPAVWLAAVAGGSLLAGQDAAAAWQTIYAYAAPLVALLIGWLGWRAWRAAQRDRWLLAAAALALLALAGQGWLATGAAAAATLSGQAGQLGLAIGLWCSVVVFSTVALRRPATVLLPAGGAVAGTPAAPTTRRDWRALVDDYISLTKPKVISLLLVTTVAAMFLTEQGLPGWALVFWTIIGGYLAAGGAGAINCAFDEDIDINMGRTSRRPVPSGRIARRDAFLFGVVLVALAVVVLASFTTWLAAGLALLGAVYYAVFYTRWLKRHTWQNIVIGGGAGSIPPLVGWAAVTGSLNLAALLLFLIVFYWTPPHFWALALVKEKDYARAGVPMLPVFAGVGETRWQIWLYSLLLVAVSLLLTPIGAMGMLYLVLAALFGALFLYYAWGVWRNGSQVFVWGLYKYSLLYLALLFAAMVADRLLVALL